ncbi:MAG: methyltransferase type 11 [Nitrospirae bacterium GWC2_42_7]|nr:MAG: methyltransferase type 11 [Nitrospirae bacterium GWC2_42_7]
MAGILDNAIRRWLQDPHKILGPYIKEGMTVLDLGCGPGFFSVEIALMAGKSGQVIAADLQEEMLQKLRDKIKGTELEKRITLLRSEENKIGLAENVDFVLAFYMVHETLDQEKLLHEIISRLKPDGHILIVEPLFHVSKTAFQETVKKAVDSGLVPVESPKVFLSRAVLMKKSRQ